jgi:probable HAF family extracellular repeat protein
MRSTTLIWFATAALGSRALGQASLTNLGVVSGDPESAAMGVSADGAVAIGASGSVGSLQFRAAVRWTAGGVARLAPSPAGDSSIALCASADGSVIAGQQGYYGFRWTSATGMQDLGTIGGGGSVNPLGISADGSLVVGFSGCFAWCWTAPTGMQNIGALPGAVCAQVHAVSASGTVIAGTSEFESGWNNATLWSGSPGQWTLQDLGSLPGQSDNEALAVSADGLVVAGTSGPRAFRWTNGGGMQDLGLPSSATSVSAEGISGDGSVIVGQIVQADGATRAAIWTPSTGVLDLAAHLSSLGVDTTGWVLMDAKGVSANGSVIVGWGTYNAQTRGWIAHLPPPCGSADFNHDGAAGTDHDIIAFFACLSGDCCSTCGSPDFNGDGAVATDADLESFFRVLAGAPC